MTTAVRPRSQTSPKTDAVGPPFGHDLASARALAEEIQQSYEIGSWRPAEAHAIVAGHGTWRQPWGA